MAKKYRKDWKTIAQEINLFIKDSKLMNKRLSGSELKAILESEDMAYYTSLPTWLVEKGIMKSEGTNPKYRKYYFEEPIFQPRFEKAMMDFYKNLSKYQKEKRTNKQDVVVTVTSDEKPPVLTEKMCINFLKSTGNYRIQKITWTEV